jgi:glycosyltransferase involved in cell wall biosynthesis
LSGREEGVREGSEFDAAASTVVDRRPEICVVVPVRNGTHHLARLVPALERQTFPRERFEVIVADDGSTDKPERFATADHWLRVLTGAPSNSYAARNRGVAASAASSIAFCDADCVPDPSWLERGTAALHTADLVAGRISFERPERRTTWAFIDMETSKNHEQLVALGLGETANLFVRRQAFDDVGGFDSSIDEHGDFDFVERCIEAGARLVFDETAAVSHPVRVRRKDVLRAHWIYSRGYAERAARAGSLPEGMKIRNWIPVLGVARSRWSRGVTLLGPDKRWLAANGIDLTVWERVRSLPAIYLGLPYWRNVAQVAGWRKGRASSTVERH